MFFDGVLPLVLPIALYLGLAFLPSALGQRASGAALAVTTVALIGAVGAPQPGYFSLEREVRALFAGALTGASAGAFACHRMARRRGALWPWRLAGLGVAVVAAGLIFVVLVRIM